MLLSDDLGAAAVLVQMALAVCLVLMVPAAQVGLQGVCCCVAQAQQLLHPGLPLRLC